MSKKTETSVALPPSLVSIQKRFALWHGAALQSAAHLKLAKYFCGLEVAALAEACEAAPGRKSGGEVPTFESIVEDAFNVSSRTARRYRVFFDAVGVDAPELADALNTLWRRFSGSDKKAKPLALPGSEKCGALVAETLTEAKLAELCKVADEMGLCELFEAPARAVDAAEESGGGGSRRAARERLLRFWGREIPEAIKRREFLRLPVDVRRALAEEFTNAAKQLKSSLKGGPAK